MKRLDGDKGLKNSKGTKCPRDIVQFITYNELGNGDMLAKELLSELPDQIVQYMSMINKLPQSVNDKINRENKRWTEYDLRLIYSLMYFITDISLLFLTFFSFFGYFSLTTVNDHLPYSYL